MVNSLSFYLHIFSFCLHFWITFSLTIHPVFSFNTLKLWLHCLLACIDSDESSMMILIIVSHVQYMFCLCLLLRFFWVYLVISNLIIICLGTFLLYCLGYWWVFGFLDRVLKMEFGKNICLNALNMFFLYIPFSTPQTPITQTLDVILLYIFPAVIRLWDFISVFSVSVCTVSVGYAVYRIHLQSH